MNCLDLLYLVQSKKRGLSLEEKREKMLQIFYESQDFFLVSIASLLNTYVRVFFFLINWQWRISYIFGVAAFSHAAVCWLLSRTVSTVLSIHMS